MPSRLGIPPLRTSPAVGVPVATPAPQADGRLSSQLLSPQTSEKVTILLSTARDKSVEVYTELEQQGAFSKFAEFNAELLRPLRSAQAVGLLAYWRELKAAATFSPEEPKSGFVLWNSLAFWLGVAECLSSSLFRSDGLLLIGIKIGLAYCVAYAAHWIFNHTTRKPYMIGGLVFLAAAALAAVGTALSTFFLVVPPLLRAAQAASIALACAHAFHIYRATANPNAPSQLRAEEALAMLPPEATSAALSLLLKQLQQQGQPAVAPGPSAADASAPDGATLSREQLAEIQKQILENPELMRAALAADPTVINRLMEQQSQDSARDCVRDPPRDSRRDTRAEMV